MEFKQLDEQDQNLEKLAKSLDNLHKISLTHGQELKLQNKMLDNLETDIESADGKIITVNKKVQNLIESKDYSCLIIGGLIIVLIVLVILIIFL